MTKFYVANFCQYHIHRPESTEEDDTSLAVHKVTVARLLGRINNINIIITRLQY